MQIRPPVAFLLEGDGEFAALPNLVRKDFGVPYYPIPLSNARGIGNITANLEQSLTDIILTSHPSRIIVTLDKADVVSAQFTTCADLRLHLENRADALIQTQQGNFGLHPLPDRIIVVVQVPRFEAWLTADPVGLIDAHLTVTSFEPHNCLDVDIEIADHRDYLRHALRAGYRKHPAEVARISKALRPSVMAQHSRSFHKFWQEVAASYSAAT